MFPLSWAPIVIPVVLGGHHRKILPYDLNGPFKQGLMSLFKLAWSSKIQLPLLITVAFLVFDVHLQMEINVFWEQGNNRPNIAQNVNNINNRNDPPLIIPIHHQVAPLAALEEDFEEDSTDSLSSLSSDI